MANFKVLIVSSKWWISGQILAIKIVLQLPPIESFRILVSLDCLYGIWSLCLSDKATVTYSKKVKDLLIYEASINYWPSDPFNYYFLPVFLVLSDPAKSTIFNLAMTTFSLDSTLLLISKWIVNTQWALDECLFNLCSLTDLLVSPSNNMLRASSSFEQISI